MTDPTPTQDTITARLEELLAATTRKRWGCFWSEDEIEIFDAGIGEGGEEFPLCQDLYIYGRDDGAIVTREDAALIVEAINALPALLSERATLKAELEEARGVLEPFANERLSMEPTVSDCLLRSAGAEMRLAAERLDARDNAIRAARAYLTKESTNGR